MDTLDNPPADPLAAIIRTAELDRRTGRSADVTRENRALTLLAQAMASSPRTILHSLAATTMDVLDAGSAGVSLLSADACGASFYWPAIAGAWAPHTGRGLRRDMSPCGVVVDRGCVQLFMNPETYYPDLVELTHPIREALLAPFFIEGRAVGT